MAIVIFCTDGSAAALDALHEGLALLRADAEPHVVTVVEHPDDTLVTGTGFTGGTMRPDEYEAHVAQVEEQARLTVRDTAAALGLDGTELRVLQGAPGPAICALAEELSASAIVMGSRGRGGLKRAVLGSVSDYTVRNAPCSTLITRHPDRQPPG